MWLSLYLRHIISIERENVLCLEPLLSNHLLLLAGATCSKRKWKPEAGSLPWSPQVVLLRRHSCLGMVWTGRVWFHCAGKQHELKGKEEGVKHRKTRKCKFIRQVYLFNGYCLKLAYMAGCIMAFSYILWLILSPLCPHHTLVPLWPEVVSFLCPFFCKSQDRVILCGQADSEFTELLLPQPLDLG